MLLQTHTELQVLLCCWENNVTWYPVAHQTLHVTLCQYACDSHIVVYRVIPHQVVQQVVLRLSISAYCLSSSIL